MLDIPGLPDLRATHLVTFTVRAGGAPLPPEVRIRQIEVVRQANRIPRASIVFDDGDAAAQDFALSGGPLLVPGTEVEVLAGYSSTEATIFKGIVTRQRVELGPRFSHLVVEAKDAAVRMTLGRASRTFAQMSDGDVLTQLIGGWPGLTADVQLAAPAVPQLVQHQCSDWDFTVLRAEAHGALVLVQDGRVTVAVPAAAGLSVAQAIFGQGLRAAAVELDATAQLAEVSAPVWDPGGQAVLTGLASDAATPGPGDLDGAALAAALGGAKGALSLSGARDQAAADALAAGTMARLRRAAVQGTLTVQGTEAMLPGALIDLAGLGARFQGQALITGVRHRLGGGDWLTEVMLGTDPRAHAERFAVAAPAAAAGAAPVAGLQIGVVTALEGDPAAEGRVEVRLPAVSLTEGTLWARIAHPDAGPDRGMHFLPEVGDEVVLGFLDADPRDPVILGSLHSSARAPVLQGKDDNHEKAIITRSGMRIHWDDDGVICSIDTPKGYGVVLSEKDGTLVVRDERDNTLTLSDTGIALETGKDITLKATGDVVIEGRNITAKASAKAAVEGGSAADLKASGTTTVKGATVMIN